MKIRIVEMARHDVLNNYQLCEYSPDVMKFVSAYFYYTGDSHNRLAYNGVVIPQAAAGAWSK